MTLSVSHVRAAEGERVEVLTVREALDAVYEDPDKVLERSALLASAVAMTLEQGLPPEDGRVALLVGWIAWPYFDLRPPMHWLTLPQRMSLVEVHSQAASDSQGAQSWRRRNQARLAAVQVVTAYFELWLDFAALGTDGEALSAQTRAWNRHCTHDAPLPTAHLTDCALGAVLLSEQGQRVRRMRGRWVLRSDVIGSLLGYPPDILLAPPRQIAPQARIRVDNKQALIDASLAANPAHQAIKAEEARSTNKVAAAWWALTGIIVGGIENPVLQSGAAPIGGFTMMMEWDYYRAAWIALQGARTDLAVKELHSAMHQEEVYAAVNDALARLDASQAAAQDALKMQQAANQAAAQALAQVEPKPLALTHALLSQRQATERLVAAIGAVLHYNLSHLEILAALGHLVLED